MKKTKAFTRFTATLLAILTVLFTFCIGANAAEQKGGAEVWNGYGYDYYANTADAWNKVAASKESTKIRLLGDWIADENGSFGTGVGFDNGVIALEKREAKLILDLNGFKIDRALKERIIDGRVFSFINCADIVIKDDSGYATGLITGGNSNGNGGAISILSTKLTLKNINIVENTSGFRGGALYIFNNLAGKSMRNSDVTIDNCVITANKTFGTGGGIYQGTNTTLRIYDSSITNNYAAYDAGIHTEVMILDACTIILGGKVKIADNYSENDGTGLTLDESFFRKVYVEYDKNRPLDNESEIVILSKTDDKTLRITDNSSDNHIGCYSYENDSYKIVAKGSGNGKYLDIKKN